MKIQRRWQQAETLLINGNLEEAEREFAELAQFPELRVAALLRISQAVERQGDLRRAIDVAIEAAHSPGTADGEGLATLVQRLLNLGEHRFALDVAALPALGGGSNVAALFQAGRALFSRDHADAAYVLLSRCLAAGVESAELHHLMGGCELHKGDSDAAEASYERSIALNADAALAHLSLAKLRQQTSSSNHIDRLRDALQRVEQQSPEAVALGYALFKELDDLGDHDTAWPALEVAMKTQRRLSNYDPEQAIKAFRDLRIQDAQLPEPPPPTSPSAGTPAPIFIVGMPCAGADLLEQALAMHPSVAAMGELTDLPRQLRVSLNQSGPLMVDGSLIKTIRQIDSLDLGRRYRAHTNWRAAGRAFMTDRLPPNFRLIGIILQAMPDARIINVHRQPVAACFAALRECFFGDSYGYSYDQYDMASYYRAYAEQMGYWNERYAGRVLHVSRETLVSSPDKELARVAKHCGLKATFVSEESAPLADGTPVIDTRWLSDPVLQADLEQWRHYASQLEPTVASMEGRA